MHTSGRVRWAIGLTGIAVAFALIVNVLPGAFASRKEKSGPGECLKFQRHLVARGRNPEGRHWSVNGTIASDTDCNGWLFGMEFAPLGGPRGGFSWRWGIPEHGSLSGKFTVAAEDEASRSGRVLGGVVGADVARIVAKTSGGSSLTIVPARPSPYLLQKYVWLRNVRYFLHFYSAIGRVKVITLLAANGRVIEKLGGIEGLFEGPGT